MSGCVLGLISGSKEMKDGKDKVISRDGKYQLGFGCVLGSGCN